MPEIVGFNDNSGSAIDDTFEQPPIHNIYKSHI